MSGARATVRAERGSAEQTVAQAIDVAVRAVARAVVEGTQGVLPLPAALVRRVRTADAVYHVRGSLLASDSAARPAVLVVVERGAPDLPSADDIRRAFGLTRKQAVVARLLAAGRTNGQIAADLFISHHTARHHTENVMARLGFRTRTEVADAVLWSTTAEF